MSTGSLEQLIREHDISEVSEKDEFTNDTLAQLKLSLISLDIHENHTELDFDNLIAVGNAWKLIGKAELALFAYRKALNVSRNQSEANEFSAKYHIAFANLQSSKSVKDLNDCYDLTKRHYDYCKDNRERLLKNLGEFSLLLAMICTEMNRDNEGADNMYDQARQILHKTNSSENRLCYVYFRWIEMRINLERHTMAPPYSLDTCSMISLMENTTSKNGTKIFCKFLDIKHRSTANSSTHTGCARIDYRQALSELANIEYENMTKRNQANYHIYLDELKTLKERLDPDTDK